MSRPGWDHYFLAMAHVVATRASCDRKHVGAVLVDRAHRIVATGYNGAAAGTPDCDTEGHLLKEVSGRQSCVRSLHAESNAIDYAGAKARDCALYVTVIPCFECAKRIVNAGIERVVYAEYYESQNSKLVAEYFAQHRTCDDDGFERPIVELVHLPARFHIKQLCINVKCGNTGRYDSGYCSLCDMAINEGRGERCM